MTELQEARHECLLQLYGAKTIPISLPHIRKVARRTGFDYTEDNLRFALHFLRDEGFAKEITDRATGEIRWQITSRGMLEYENGN